MKRLKFITSICLVVSLLFLSSVPSFGTEAYSYESEASVLNALGLYQGVSDTSFDPDLGTALNRETGVVMLLRLFGIENEARAMSDSDVNAALSRFSDAGSISGWARNSVAYAINNGLVQGLPNGTFGARANLNGKAYCTLILRQLGFTPDYNSAPAELAEAGGLTGQQAAALQDKPLIRDDLVGISFGSLHATGSNGKTVIETLVDRGAVTQTEASAVGITPPPNPPAAPSNSNPHPHHPILSSDANLLSLVVTDDSAAVKLYPNFDPNKTHYSAAIESGHTMADIAAVKSDPAASATFRMDLIDVSNPISVSGDSSEVNIAVRAENGTVKTYTVTIYRGKTITDGEVTQAGIYGPASGTENVSSSLIVSSPGVVLRNLDITGDLTLGAGIGGGDAFLDNVTVSGITAVNGGGSNSIHFEGNTSLGAVVVQDLTGISNNKIHIVNEDNSQTSYINIKTPVIIDDNASGSSIEYIKASKSGLATIEGSNADALIEKIIEKANYFIDQCYDTTPGAVKAMYGSINMLNNNETGIHSLKQYLYPLETEDENSPDIVPAALQTEYDAAQSKYLKLWDDWYNTFPLLGAVKNSNDITQNWITRSGDYSLTRAEQQYMLQDCYRIYSIAADVTNPDLHIYGGDSMPPDSGTTAVINIANVKTYLDNLQKKYLIKQVSITDTIPADSSLIAVDKVTITFDYNNAAINWDSVVSSIAASNSAFNVTTGAISTRSINIAGRNFTDVPLKTIELTPKTSVLLSATITIPHDIFDLGIVQPMIVYPVEDIHVTAPDVTLILPLQNFSW